MIVQVANELFWFSFVRYYLIQQRTAPCSRYDRPLSTLLVSRRSTQSFPSTQSLIER